MGHQREICVVAGEPSGDLHAGAVVADFGELFPEFRWFGAGGPHLSAAGMELLVPMERLAVVGIAEVLRHLPDLWRAMGILKRALRERHPEALMLVDFPDFNFRLAKYAHGLKIPVVYYITPQVWAWRPGRVEFLKRFVDKALVIFPFEETFLRERGLSSRFVGHPLVHRLKVPSSREAFCTRHGIHPERPIVGLLPGSRGSEVRRNLPILLNAARLAGREFPAATFFVPWADSLRFSPPGGPGAGPVRFVRGDYYDVLGHADAAAVASGTATLEAALLGTPQVVVYRLQPLTYAIGRRLVSLPRVALPNIVLGRDEIPELIQRDFTAENVAASLAKILRDVPAARRKAREVSLEVRGALGEGKASVEAAWELFRLIQEREGPGR